MTIQLRYAEKGLVSNSQEIYHKTKSDITTWSNQDHQESLKVMKNQATSESYMFIAKEPSFTWEYVPYAPCKTAIGRAIQQIQVVWRIAFGGIPTSQKESQITKNVQKAAENDAFCKASTIDKQWVITGKKVNVLFNYAPIGLGGEERLHFLIVPKAHRTRFTDITRDEYRESMQFATKLISHFKKTRKSSHAYLFHKTGRDAGQTVPHWHMHLIFAQTKAQDFLSKLQLVKNILFGSTPLKADLLQKRVLELREELRAI